MMENTKRIEKILQKNGNKTCAECADHNPRWASVSLGVLVCIRCCGVHRGLGRHISKIKSTSLDNWTSEDLEIFELIDNNIANSYWEADKDFRYQQITDKSGICETETFLRDKYQRKIWANKEINFFEFVNKLKNQKKIKKVMKTPPSELITSLIDFNNEKLPLEQKTITINNKVMRIKSPKNSKKTSENSESVLNSVRIQEMNPMIAELEKLNFNENSIEKDSFPNIFPTIQEPTLNAKISKILSAFSFYLPRPCQSSTFVPLGAIAAQRIFLHN